MIISTPYIECHIKKSFLSGSPKFGRDETIFGVIVGMRIIRGSAPHFVCYLPSIGALYDKVSQCAIFSRQLTPEESIDLRDVAWWDCLSDHADLTQIQSIKGMWCHLESKTNKKFEGSYLFTVDFAPPRDCTDYGQGAVWHEHKTKTFFFDEHTGALVCGPNNKLRLWDSSLCPPEFESASWLRVYKENHQLQSHEIEFGFGGQDGIFDYQVKK